ncbi:hypothetical protein EMIHUDRAFT_443596 [Emiliania huxleyi CCMP1516]|uniref:Fe2OG dioxygenase domain-containing protein n=3 Tax=Emiliania huxleyi TaxID=2903 RepID=A0A0D3JPV2_EMIH1|nr:hypothetical protein EMIHUDRAFT_443596 [Emiliania huxleyi CCMP1516]EOD25537.1 hypothetical protein EMIHUDRAFT_443596 [Emiliania huxleyi CCMP1516]|eukprot:XP_005777966.1 hypothetical protein EMIHUDRAFT_443596 [Emiliania huxleyi CCMP1516]
MLRAAPGRVARQEVAGVPGAFLLHGVLGREEAAAILRLAQRMGFRTDHPVSRPAPSPTRGCEWLADASLLGPMFARASPLLPAEVGGGRLEGINPRWRLFEYRRGAIYRPHIDGSWPMGGLDQDGGYVHDLHGAAVRSRLTFLVYLNDGFDGGCTTFFQPAAAPAGAQRELDRFEVTPLAGSALCFPQSATASLLHEGSPVTRGVKYVIRTDVLYRF